MLSNNNNNNDISNVTLIHPIQDNKIISDRNNSTNHELLLYSEINTIINNINKEDNIEKQRDEFIDKLISFYGIEYIEKIINKQKEKKNKGEPLLNSENHKFTAFPIIYPTIWKKYKEQMACFWTPEEIDFSGDYHDFLTLTKNEQYFIEMILAFFAASDGIINFNLSERFIREVKITEAQFAYQFQMMMENCHSEVYSLMLDNIVKDPERKQFLFNAIKTVPSVEKMANWAFKWIESSKNFAYRIVAFAIVEGIFFSGAFAAIFWLKKYKNKNRQNSSGKPFMNGLVTSNKFIARDEGLHLSFACELYSLLKNKLNNDEINNILIEAIDIAKNFMNDALPVKLIGMNSDDMSDYIEYIGDRLLYMLGYKKLFNKKNPFKFMETIGLDDKSNFFELRPHEYQNSHVMNKSKKEIIISEDF